jgi:hydrogenase-4 component F
VTATFVILLTVPLLAAVACLRSPVRACQAVTITAGVVSLATAVVLVPTAAHQDLTLGRYLRADAISVVFLLATSFLYAAVSAYSVGYLAGEAPTDEFSRYARRSTSA